MRGVRIVGVGPTLTAAVPADAIARVYGALTLYHVAGELHRLSVQDGAVVDVAVPKGSADYLRGMAAFSTEDD